MVNTTRQLKALVVTMILLLGTLVLVLLTDVDNSPLQGQVPTGIESAKAQRRADSTMVKNVYIDSLDDIKTLFDSLKYNTQSWDEGNREVPRLTFQTVTERWQKTAQQIPVREKKMIFFRLMAPLILIANENILFERQQIEDLALGDPALLVLAQKYGIVENTDTKLTEKHRQELLQEVDIMPPSLVLAQAAKESGWATSRFTVEGNAYFGQWDFSGKGMKPKRQREDLGNYGVAQFDTPLESVEGYLLNLNTSNAYQELRRLRAKLRADNKPITGLELATTLDKYSERGQAYVDAISEMIRYNELQQVDEAYLADTAPLHLIAKEDDVK